MYRDRALPEDILRWELSFWSWASWVKHIGSGYSPSIYCIGYWHFGVAHRGLGTLHRGGHQKHNKNQGVGSN